MTWTRAEKIERFILWFVYALLWATAFYSAYIISWLGLFACHMAASMLVFFYLTRYRFKKWDLKRTAMFTQALIYGFLMVAIVTLLRPGDLDPKPESGH